ncbi:MAG: hypothetical protein GY947_18515 [Rhodobacteraceae bacterium]|nr:hypothetical protein [Paracoccaceae bacterium]
MADFGAPTVSPGGPDTTARFPGSLRETGSRHSLMLFIRPQSEERADYRIISKLTAERLMEIGQS